MLILLQNNGVSVLIAIVLRPGQYKDFWYQDLGLEVGIPIVGAS